MVFADLLSISLRQIARNKRRYHALIAVIAVGIFGLVVVPPMGNAIEEKIGSNLELLARATILEAGWDFEKQTRWHHGEFDVSDVRSLASLPWTRSATAFVRKDDQIFHWKDVQAQGRLLGVEGNFFSTFHIGVSQGREIVASDVAASRHVCVLGRSLLPELFPDSHPPLGESIVIEGLTCVVVGVLGGVEDRDYDSTVLVPISVARSQFFVGDKISGIYVRARNWHVVPKLRNLVVEALTRRHPAYTKTLEIQYYPEKLRNHGAYRIPRKTAVLLWTDRHSGTWGAWHCQSHAGGRTGADRGNRFAKSPWSHQQGGPGAISYRGCSHQHGG